MQCYADDHVGPGLRHLDRPARRCDIAPDLHELRDADGGRERDELVGILGLEAIAAAFLHVDVTVGVDNRCSERRRRGEHCQTASSSRGKSDSPFVTTVPAGNCPQVPMSATR